MRIAVIADTFPPIRISGAVQMRDLVREFAVQGHEITAIVPSASQMEPWMIERTGNLTVLRVRTPPTKDVNYLRRTINEMRLPYALLRGMMAAGVGLSGWDGVVWYSPTIFLGPIVRQIRRASNCKSYLILRDIFPEWVVDMGLMRRGLAYRFFKWIEAGQYAVADTIGVQCEANLAYLKHWAAQPGRQLEVLENWLSPAPVAGCRIDISETRLAGRKIFVYTGNMGVAQGMDVFLEMVARMSDRKDLGFVFVGRGSEAARYAMEAESMGLDNILFYDEIEPEEVPGLLVQCHVAMLALDPRHHFHNLPGKFIAYMQAGLPVLARVNPGNDLAKLIVAHNVGRVCTGGDAAMLQRMAEQIIIDTDVMQTTPNGAIQLWHTRFSSSAVTRQIVRRLTGKNVQGSTSA